MTIETINAIARKLAEATALKRQNQALRWLLQNSHDSELAAVIENADQNDCLEELLEFMAWALERGFLTISDHDCDSCPMPF